MKKVGGKTQLGVGIAVALIALYIGGASVAMHDAFKHRSDGAKTTAAPTTNTSNTSTAPVCNGPYSDLAGTPSAGGNSGCCITNPDPDAATTTPIVKLPGCEPTTGGRRQRRDDTANNTGNNTTTTNTSTTTPTPSYWPGKHTGSYTHAALEDNELDDAYTWGMTVTILGYVFISVSAVMFVFDISSTISDKTNIDDHRWWISGFIAVFAMVLVIFSGLVSFHNASSRPSLVNLKDTKFVGIDVRDFYNLENTSETTDNLCYTTMKDVTNQFDAADPIKEFKTFHLAVFVAFVGVMLSVGLQEIKARIIRDEPSSPGDEGDTNLKMGTVMLTHLSGTVTFVLALTFLIMAQGNDRDMLAKSAGTWNPGLNFTGTFLENNTKDKGETDINDELFVYNQIQEMIGRFNGIPEMEELDKVSTDIMPRSGVISVPIETAFVVTCVTGDVFKEQGKLLCDTKLERDTGLNNRRNHFTIAWILYMIGGVHCLILSLGALSSVVIKTEIDWLQWITQNIDRILPPYEIMMIGGAFALVTHMNSHTVLTNCDILEDSHVEDSEDWYGVYAALIAFSLFTGMLSTIGDHIGNAVQKFKGTLMSQLY